MQEIIKVENLCKYYKNIKAVDGVSFSVMKGQVVAILGPNGAGKTTTVETLEGLRKASSGDLFFFGKKTKEVTSEIKEKIGVQLQSSTFLNSLKVHELLTYFGELYKKRIPVEDLLKTFSLEEKKDAKIKNLSGGQLQRVAIAASVVNNPEIVFLDEPTTGLDPQARRNLWQSIINLKKMGKTIILTTHYMEEAERLADYIFIFDHGKIISEGTVNSLVESLNMNSIISFYCEKEITSIDKIEGDFSTDSNNNYKIKTSNVEKDLIRIFEYTKLNNLRIDDLSIRNPNLEDVFIKLTGRTLRD